MGSTPARHTKRAYVVYFVYILQSLRTNCFYIGTTDDLVRRFHQHQTGRSTYTCKCGPWWMTYYEIHADRSSALHREREIKHWKSSTRIQRLIAESFPP
ncbi:MAG: GIY-YIG nuclease family protein [Verrucomicrobia bacterium]|nr:MAG: GIY-YIG nuclease family protein [Verrucomicrobiota bacterium]